MNADRLAQLEIKLRAAALDQRKAALDELATCPSDLAVPMLQRLAQEPDFGQRRLAVMGLGNHRTEASLQVLQEILSQEKDPNVLAEAANSLFEFGDVAMPWLQTIFEQSDNWLVRQTIISLLVETQHYAILLAVVELAIKDETQTVKEAGILALSHLWTSDLKERALAWLTVLAQDDDWRVRWRSAIALQTSRTPQAQHLIAQLQQDSHFRVVAAALDVANYWASTQDAT
jgi:HEAT repeat protein